MFHFRHEVSLPPRIENLNSHGRGVMNTISAMGIMRVGEKGREPEGAALEIRTSSGTNGE